MSRQRSLRVGTSNSRSMLSRKYSKEERHQQRRCKEYAVCFLEQQKIQVPPKDKPKFVFRWQCLRNLAKNRREGHYKEHYLFSKAEKKFRGELDVVRIVKTLRRQKMFAQAILSQKHRLILKSQRENLFVTSYSSQSYSDDNSYDEMRLMESKNLFVRLKAFSKIKIMLNQLKGLRINSLERSMMRRLFLRKLKDFAEDAKKNSKLPLYELLTAQNNDISFLDLEQMGNNSNINCQKSNRITKQNKQTPSQNAPGQRPFNPETSSFHLKCITHL